MSLTLCVTTAEGIVLSADSRQTYRIGNSAPRIGSDSVTKVIPVSKLVGVTVAGPAFLEEVPGSPKNISSIIRDYAQTIKGKDKNVDTISKELRKYLEKLYKPDEQIKKIEELLTDQIKKQKGKIVDVDRSNSPRKIIIKFTDANGKPGTGIGEVDPITLVVAGYDKTEEDSFETKVNVVYIPGKTDKKRLKGQEYGAVWSGQTDVVQRIILGKDGRLEGAPFVIEAKKQLGEDVVRKQIAANEYHISWGTMSLFDAIDFSELMIKTTSAIQRFANGTLGNPGGIPGVGGPVDIAVITPETGFKWNKKKELTLIEPEL